MTNDQLKEELTKFLESEDKELELPMAPLSYFAKIFHEAGFNTIRSSHFNLVEEGNNWETNGWQVDFWWTMIHENKDKFYLEGSVWYGNFKLKRQLKHG